MQRLILFSISFLFLPLLFSQRDSSSWHLSGQSIDQSVKAFFITGRNISCPNVLIYKKDQIWDTLYLCTYASMLPYFKDSCTVESIQMDGEGLNEIVLSWDYQRIYKNAQINYTFYMIWDLDTEKRIFYMTPYYHRMSEDHVYSIDIDGKILDTTSTLDSCIYKSDFKIDPNGQILNLNITQTGECPDDGCWKKFEGVYFYENKKLQWKKME